MFPPFLHPFLQYFWLVMIVFVVGLAAVWRIKARPRIAADPALRQPLNRLYGGFAFWLSLPFALIGAGVLTGALPHTLAHLSFDADNPFVVAVWLLGAAENALFIWWVFFRGGADRIALHAELPVHRPQARLFARVLAAALPLVHLITAFYATSSPHFGQLLGA